MPKLTVNEDGQGVRLDRFLRREGFHFPQSLFEKWSRQKKLLINGVKAKASSRLNTGDILEYPDNAVSQPAPEMVAPIQLSQSEAEAELRGMIVFEDEDLLVLNKPSGLATQGGTGQRISVDDMLAAAFPNNKYRLTHRIDKETSGILLIAKNYRTAASITEAFRKREVSKTYMAVCSGILSEKEGVLDAPIGKSKENLEMMSIKGFEVKEAITHYKVIDERESESIIELSPKTGRTHQLRVHMQLLGHPIVGDKKYGGPKASRLMLHAWKISWDGRSFEAPLPNEFKLDKTS